MFLRDVKARIGRRCCMWPFVMTPLVHGSSVVNVRNANIMTARKNHMLKCYFVPCLGSKVCQLCSCNLYCSVLLTLVLSQYSLCLRGTQQGEVSNSAGCLSDFSDPSNNTTDRLHTHRVTTFIPDSDRNKDRERAHICVVTERVAQSICFNWSCIFAGVC